jgi:hypothetical protein
VIQVIRLGTKTLWKYFEGLSKTNDLSLTARAIMVYFPATAHAVMLEWLRKAQGEGSLSGSELHDPSQRKVALVTKSFSNM